MIVKILAENTAVSDDFKCEHGLSLYIETKKHKLLFDTGASPLFAENAAKLGVDLSAVDTAVISHGHHDHGGGLGTFLTLNTKAKVYLRKNAFEPCFANKPDGEKAYIGLDAELQSNHRLVFTGESLILDDELKLFSAVKGNRLSPSGNVDLFVKTGGILKHDDFSHEQSLLVRENGKTLLLAGCSHCGIINILEKLKFENGMLPDAVIGGFHLYNPNNKLSEDPGTVSEIGQYLLDTGAKFYTCHCTGIESYRRLKDIMGRRIDYLSAGSVITI